MACWFVGTNHWNQSKRSRLQNKNAHEGIPAHMQINWLDALGISSTHVQCGSRESFHCCRQKGPGAGLWLGWHLLNGCCKFRSVCYSYRWGCRITGPPQTISSNLEPNLLDRIIIRKLFWGNKDDLREVRELSGNDTGFDCIRASPAGDLKMSSYYYFWELICKI